MCVLFHKPHMDPLHSFHVCSYTKTNTRVIACVFFSQTTHGSTTRVIACVLFPQTTHVSTNGHCISVPESLHVCSFHKPHMDQPLESLHGCSYTKTTNQH